MKRLGQSAIGTGSGTLIYTVPTGYETEVQDFFVANTTGSAITCSLHFVPSGSAVSAANAILYNVTIAANSTIHWCGNQIINAAGFIQAIGGSSGLTITVSGTENRKVGAS